MFSSMETIIGGIQSKNSYLSGQFAALAGQAGL
jgi:hypothetical protein